MADSQAAGQTQGSGSTTLGVDMIDMLIRNLETAKADFEGGKEFAEGPTFCALLYAQPGQLCPFFYYHSLTETKPVE